VAKNNTESNPHSDSGKSISSSRQGVWGSGVWRYGVWGYGGHLNNSRHPHVIASSRSIAVTHIISVCRGHSHSCICSLELKYYCFCTRGRYRLSHGRKAHLFYTPRASVIAARYKFVEPARLTNSVCPASAPHSASHLGHERRGILYSAHHTFVRT
jgi:hypothetical protein